MNQCARERVAEIRAPATRVACGNEYLELGKGVGRAVSNCWSRLIA